MTFLFVPGAYTIVCASFHLWRISSTTSFGNKLWEQSSFAASSTSLANFEFAFRASRRRIRTQIRNVSHYWIDSLSIHSSWVLVSLSRVPIVSVGPWRSLTPLSRHPLVLWLDKNGKRQASEKRIASRPRASRTLLSSFHFIPSCTPTLSILLVTVISERLRYA